MPVQLPLDPVNPNYRVGTVLGGEQFILDIRWNGRDGAWYMDILAEDEDPIVQSLKLVLGSVPGLSCVDPRAPRGIFEVVDLSGAGIDAKVDDLGTRVIVLFFEVEEVD